MTGIPCPVCGSEPLVVPLTTPDRLACDSRHRTKIAGPAVVRGVSELRSALGGLDEEGELRKQAAWAEIELPRFTVVGWPAVFTGGHAHSWRATACPLVEERSEAERRGRGQLSGPVTGGSLPATPWVPRRFIGGQEHLHRDGSSGERLAGLPVGLLPGQEEVWLSLLCSVHPQPTSHVATLTPSARVRLSDAATRAYKHGRPSRSCPVGSPRTAP